MKAEYNLLAQVNIVALGGMRIFRNTFVYIWLRALLVSKLECRRFSTVLCIVM